MIKHAIIDTGPLVAFFDRDESNHNWAVDQVKRLSPPLLVCEPVLTEAMFLLNRLPAAQGAIFGLLENGALVLQFSLAENASEIKALMRKYKDRSVSLADACLVRMSELHSRHFVLTLDSDFHVYRKHGRQPIKLICPALE